MHLFATRWFYGERIYCGAQLDQELAKRSLTVPPEALRSVIVQFERPASSVFSGLAKMLRRVLRH